MSTDEMPTHKLSMDGMLSATFDEHAAVVAASRSLSAELLEVVSLCQSALANGGKILLCGNGGSAADCQHIATELTIRFERERRALAALALTTDTSALTAATNDLGGAFMFSRQIDAIGRIGDVLLALSTSGHSPNVIEALRASQQIGMTTVLFGGRDGGPARALADIALIVPSDRTARIQEVHILLGHMLCGALEAGL